MVRRAEKKFFDEKQELRESINTGNLAPEAIIEKSSKIVGKELIEYIIWRDQIVSQLAKMNNSYEQDENQIHNLLLKKGEYTNDDFNPLELTENNLWIIDDKFMSYNYVASERRLNTLLKKADADQTESTDRFDIGLYSNSADAKKVVLVELKKFSADYKELSVGVGQLLEYATTLSKCGISEIYLYLLAKIDEKFTNQLKENFGFSKVFSHAGEVYQRSQDKYNAYVQIVSPDALIADSAARNKTFIDLIKKNFKKTNSKK